MHQNLHTFTCTARRDGYVWLVVCDQDPSFFSRVASLSDAKRAMLRVLAVDLGVAQDSITVDVHPVLPKAVREHITRARELRHGDVGEPGRCG